MTPPILKTLHDCAVCPVLRYCDAHNTGGEWQHGKGVQPCQVVLQ